MQTFLAFIWAPLVLYAVCLALGLLAERLLRLELPNALLPPVGLAILIALVMPVYRLGAGWEVAVGVTLAGAVVGVVLARRLLPGRLNPGLAGLSAVCGYALYVAPVALSGDPTWPGYNFVNDTASNFIFANLLSDQGVSLPAALDSSTATIEANPVNLGYPMGAHGLLATLRPLTGVDLSEMYHPTISAVAGLAAMAMTQLARGAGLRPPAAAVAGTLPIGAVLLYRYGLHGAIKEVLVVALLTTAAALAREALDRELSLRLMVLIALCAASLLHVFSAVGAGYALVLGILLLAVALVEGQAARTVGRLAAGGVAIAVVAVAVNLSDVTSFAKHASDTFANEGGVSTAYLGHLVRPLPLSEAAGVWLARDYRLPVAPDNELPNALFIVLVALLATVGVVLELRRRRPAGLLLFVPLAVIAAALVPRLSPYAGGKLLVVLSPAFVLMAAIGALGLIGQRMRALGVAAGVALAGVAAGVLISDAIGYREATLAPADRMAAMKDAADHAGGGLWLVNEWEEFAKYFMRDIRVNAAFEAESPKPAELRDPRPIFGRYYDLDELTLGYVQSFPGMIKRRSPVASRPPASFGLSYANEYYEVWRRRPGVRVVEHLALQRRHGATARPRCADIRRLPAQALRGDRVVAAAHPPLALLEPLRAGLRPKLWVPNGNAPGTVVPVSPGEMRVQRRTRGGLHRVWIRGSFGRPTSAMLDGKEVGAAHEVNTPGQWVEVGEVRLSRGEHDIALVRPDSRLGPGDAYRGELGPVALEPVGGSKLVSVDPRRAERLCGREWDWIELVRPS